MKLDLTEPGAHDETFRPITVAANTEVTVSVKWSQPLSLVGDAADPNLEKRPFGMNWVFEVPMQIQRS